MGALDESRLVQISLAVMTMYLTIRIVGFVSVHAWVLATRLRATLE